MEIGPGSYVLIGHGGTPEFFADLLALWSLGACAVCIAPSATTLELENIVRFTSPSLMLVDKTVPKEDLGLPVICSAREVEGQNADASWEFEIAGGEGDPALILFTSGTTGDPKGVVHSFGSIQNRIRLNSEYIDDGVMQNTLCVLPTHFGHGLIGNCLTPIFAGNNLFLSPFAGIASAVKMSNVIDSNGITFMSSVPSLWKLVLRSAEPPTGATLKQICVGSAPLSANLWQEIIDWAGIENVVNMYGITEMANWISGISARDHVPQDGLIGTMWGGKAALLDSEGETHEFGEGELIVKSPSMMTEYYQRPDLTADALSHGWFRTGDLARISPEGIMVLTGRKKNEINRGGQKVQPEEIDSILEGHPDILEACTFGLPDEIAGEIVATAVCFRSSPGPDSRMLRAWCEERLRREYVPERWFFVDDIPKTERGKINRQQVLEYCLRRAEA
jgi:acyl-CoA synthetase (AMP-forming)/AMP-acid ligase II